MALSVVRRLMRALHSDWQAVGNDLRQAMAQYRQEKSKQLTNG